MTRFSSPRCCRTSRWRCSGSADGRFCRTVTSYYVGWVPAEDIGLCRDLEAWRTAQEGGFLRVTGSRVTLCCDPL